MKIDTDEKYEYEFDVWTKKDSFLERSNPLSSFDTFYKNVDVIMIQADFDDRGETKKRNKFYLFNQFKIEHFLEIQEVLSILPQISSPGHDPKPLIVFQKFNYNLIGKGESEASSRFDSIQEKQGWHVDSIEDLDLKADTMTDAQRFGWRSELVEQKKGKHTQVEMTLKKKPETKDKL